MEDALKKEVTDLILETVSKYNTGPGFTDRMVTDTPTDAFAVVNKQYVDNATSRVATLTDGATVALDASLGFIFLLTATGDRTISVPTNPRSGKKIIIAHKASGADRTLSLTTGSAGAFRFGVTVNALSATTSGKIDYIGCIYNLADDRWEVVAVSKGY